VYPFPTRKAVRRGDRQGVGPALGGRKVLGAGRHGRCRRSTRGDKCRDSYAAPRTSASLLPRKSIHSNPERCTIKFPSGQLFLEYLFFSAFRPRSRIAALIRPTPNQV